MPWWSSIANFFSRTPQPTSAGRLVPSMTARAGGIMLTDELPGGSDWARCANRMARTSPVLMSCEQRVTAAVAQGLPIMRAGRGTRAARRYADHMNLALGIGVDAQNRPLRRGYLRNSFSQMIKRAVAGELRCGWATFDVGPPRVQPDGLSYPWGWFELDAEGLAPNPWVEAAEHGRLGSGHHHVETVPGDLIGIRYSGGSNGEAGTASGHRALHFRLDPRAADWEGGRGLYRPCYFWWRLATLVAEVLGIASERYGTGIPVVREDVAAARAAQISPADHRATVAELMELAQRLGVGESAAMARTNSAWIEMFDGGFDPAKLVAVHAHCLEQMRAAFLLDVMTLANAGGGGSYNLGQVLTHAFTALVAHIAQGIEETINGLAPFQGALFACLSHSYGRIDPADIPVLRIEGLQEPAFSDHLSLLVNLLAIDAPTNHPQAWAHTAAATHFDRRDVELIVEEARARSGEGMGAGPMLAPGLPNLDPGAGGLPTSSARMARIGEAFAPDDAVIAAAEGRSVDLTRYTLSNAQAAAHLNIRPGLLNSLAARSGRAGVDVPAIGGRTRLRRWDQEQLHRWYDEATALAGSEAA